MVERTMIEAAGDGGDDELGGEEDAEAEEDGLAFVVDGVDADNVHS
jgi:hypothetical protein